jgi:hypothetical protein
MRTQTARRIVNSVLRASEKGDDRQNDKYNEKNFRDSGRAGCNTAKAEYRCNDGNDEKDDCVIKHGGDLRILLGSHFPCAEFGLLCSRAL